MREEFTEPGPFKKGDVVKVVRADWMPHYVGSVITITGPIEKQFTWAGDVYCHPTDQFYQGRTIYVQPENVRGRKPPSSGENAIMSMFRLDHRDRVTA